MTRLVVRPLVTDWSRVRRAALRAAVSLAVILAVATDAFAQVSPWEHAVGVLRTSFTGTIAKGLSLIAVVVGGLTFAFSEGGSKRLLAGIIFGVGMAVGASNFVDWLFP